MENSIIQRDNPILRQKAKEVGISEIKSAYVQNVIKNMNSALSKEKDGVALAAPQIAISLRIFVVAGIAFDIAEGTYEENRESARKNMVFINPVITKTSKSRKDVEEGCLSVRWKYGKISRATKATVEAYDENGKKFSYGGTGLIAQIFQHETDHLDGKLFIDNAHDIIDLPPKQK